MAGAGGEDDVVKRRHLVVTAQFFDKPRPLLDVILGLVPRISLHRLQMLGTSPSMTKEELAGCQQLVAVTCR